MAGLEVVVTISVAEIMARALVAVGHPGGMVATDSEVEVMAVTTAVIAMKAPAAANMMKLLARVLGGDTRLSASSYGGTCRRCGLHALVTDDQPRSGSSSDAFRRPNSCCLPHQ